jgi:hypothetical protein
MNRKSTPSATKRMQKRAQTQGFGTKSLIQDQELRSKNHKDSFEKLEDEMRAVDYNLENLKSYTTIFK